MTTRAQEDAKRGVIAGKPLAEWVNAPAGAFAKAVRETGVDPKFGLREPTDADEPIRKWEVEIDYTYSSNGTATYIVEAANAEEAEELAVEEFKKDDMLDGEDCEISDIGEPVEMDEP